jgi:Asp-tRNA(Asn)/Glu-tRNA(Gln) amidotransferase A subunit family amidase
MTAMGDAFGDLDVILTPTTPTVAPPLDEGVRGTAYTRYTTVAAFTGLPAAALPAGTGFRGLPVGVQLIGAARRDATVLAVASMLERLLAADADRVV